MGLTNFKATQNRGGKFGKYITHGKGMQLNKSTKMAVKENIFQEYLRNDVALCKEND